MHMRQVVVSDWQNWFRNLSDVNIWFQRGSSEADCSIWLFCRVQKWNDISRLLAECTEMWTHIYRIWHASRCITVHKLANELDSRLVYAVKFWHQIEFVIDCVKISALYADWWVETIRTASVRARTLRRNVRHSHFLARGHYRLQHRIFLPAVDREVCSYVKCLLMLVLMFW